MSAPRVSTLALIAASAVCVFAEAVKDREGAVRGDRTRMEQNGRWIYDDYGKGFEEAKRTGKPLLVVLRCVPCLACMGIDAQVLLEGPELGRLLDQFVCVRLINANALDLRLFQFDYDLSFTTLFFNADGTVYGRYGSWKHQKSSQDTATAGFRKALEGALAVHGGYPANKASLEPKQGLPTPFKTPTEIPELAERYKPQLDWEGKVAQSCVHCHMIGAAHQAWHRSRREPMPERWLHPWPEPETVGITLAAEERAKVESVAPGSLAVAAGLAYGDEILEINGAPMLSIADVSWALHRAESADALSLKIRRTGKEEQARLSLPNGWRWKSDVAKRVSIWPMRGMALGGLKFATLAGDERARRQVAAGGMALLVENVGQYGKHGAAKKAGFQKGDVIVEFDGLTHDLGEAELLRHLLTKRNEGEKVDVVVLRNGDRLPMRLPMQ